MLRKQNIGKALFVGAIVGAAAFGGATMNAEAVGPIIRPCGPKYCLDVWNPVICPNGQIYSNSCYAARACQTGCVPANF